MSVISLKKNDMDYLTDDVVLDLKDQKDIYKRKQENDKRQRLYVVDKESKQLDNNIYIDDLKNEGERLDAECAVTEQRIRNAKNTAKLGKLDRAIDFNNAITENQKQDIKNIKKRAKKFSKGSTATGIVSALTTCVSVGITTYATKSNLVIWLVSTLFSCVAILFAAVWANQQVKSLISFKDKFFDSKKKQSTGILIGKCVIIVAYTLYSVWTNFSFWGLFFDGFGSTLFSIFFDITSIILAFESEKYQTLEFNERYVNEINSVFEENTFRSYKTDEEYNVEEIEQDNEDDQVPETNLMEIKGRPFGENQKKNMIN